MKTYHKIQTIFKRNPEDNYRTLIIGDFSVPEFEFLQDNIWTWDEKIDGTNIRIMYNGESITFAGKADKSQIPPKLLNTLNETFIPKLDQFKLAFKKPEEEEELEVCLYGEGYGSGIQKRGSMYRKDQNFILFDININGWWLLRSDVKLIAERLKIDVVPTIGEGTLWELFDKVKTGFNSQWGDFPAEGIVARPKVALRSRRGGRIITKLKYEDFPQNQKRK